MLNVKKQKGFSLAEVLMATGILALGMAFIAGVFPAGIHYTIISTERTMATVVADEAFAKIRLYGIKDMNLPPPAGTGTLPDVGYGCAGSWEVIPPGPAHRELLYPSDLSLEDSDKQYCWSALYRRLPPVFTKPGESLVQVTVFVCRKTGIGTEYYQPPDGTTKSGTRGPAPVKVNVSAIVNNNKITIRDDDKRTYITVGGTIVNDISGRIYRVVERDSADTSSVYLDKVWQEPTGTADVWAVPAAVGGGRYPCVGVFQREILF